MDVRELNLRKYFDLIFIPFHSFAELLTTTDQRRTLDRVREHLSDHGHFICTLHNPSVRLKHVDAQMRLWGNHPLEQACGTLLFWGMENYDPDTHIVNGFEFFEEYAASGILLTKRMVELHFRIIEKNEFDDLAERTGFKTVALYGDYDRSDFHDKTSPFMIWMLRRT